MFLLVGVSVFVHMAVVFGTVCRFVLVGVFVGLALLIYVMIVLCYLFLVCSYAHSVVLSFLSVDCRRHNKERTFSWTQSGMFI